MSRTNRTYTHDPKRYNAGSRYARTTNNDGAPIPLLIAKDRPWYVAPYVNGFKRERRRYERRRLREADSTDEF